MMREKILVIHQGALGDLVLNFPALVSLKQQKKAFVALLCSSDLGKIAYELNVVDAHFSIESARFCSLFCEEMTPVVRGFIRDYDTIILISFSDDIEGHLRQNHGGEVHKVRPRPPVEEDAHVAAYIIEQLEARGLLSECGMRNAECGMRTRSVKFSSRQAQPCAKSKTMDLKEENLIIMHPGAGSRRKRWPVENFVQVALIIRGMDIGKVVFLVGPAEPDLAPLIKARSKGDFRIYEVCDLSRVMFLVRQAMCFVGNDSGVTHLAAFMGTPTVAIFGPSNPKRWSPLGRVTRVLRGASGCPPCFEVEKENCKDPQCLSGISVDMLIDVVRDLTRFP